VKILVIGAGAIGCLVGGKLAQAGESVTLVGRPAFAAAVNQNGLRIHDELGVHTVRSLHAVGRIADAFTPAIPGSSPYDLTILTVKSYDTALVLSELAPHLPQAAAYLLSLQNGVGNEETIAAAYGPGSVLAGTLTTPVSVPAPGSIRIDRPSYRMGLSPWQTDVPTAVVPTAVVSATAAALERAGFKLRVYPHAQGMKWTKLLMNMVGNATSAILDQPPAALFADSRITDLEIAAWRETLAVMAAADIPPVNLGSYPFATLAPLIRHAPRPLLAAVLRRQVGGARGSKLPSLHIDLHQGKAKSEIGWLNGAVVKRGASVGVATPVNRALTDTLTHLLSHPDERAQWRGQVARLVAAAQAATATV
jgi:2-dehydropantoate 2-reductase